MAIGLALLVFMPLPFMRSMGVGGLLVPLVSIAASATFLPALLAVMGRGVNRFRVIPQRDPRAPRRARRDRRLAPAGGCDHAPPGALPGGAAAAFMLALALPALGLHLTGGDNRGVPLTTEATTGSRCSSERSGPGALAPHQIVVDTDRAGGAFAPAVRRGAAPAGRRAARATPRCSADARSSRRSLVPRGRARGRPT